MGTPALRTLIVDDEPNIRSTLRACLEAFGAEVHEASNPQDALAATVRFEPELVFLDLRLGPADGLDILPRILQAGSAVEVVVMTAYASFPTAVEAVKRGAMDYLPKPFTPAQIRHVLDTLAARRLLGRRIDDLKGVIAEQVPEALLASRSPIMRNASEIVSRAAGSDASVLLRGESGTGKGVLARLLHERSPRAEGRFVTVSCPTLTEEMLTAELFGHMRGAFTGASRDRPGVVERADGGTLFLDEVAEIPPPLQAKVLRFAQDREFERVGDDRTRRADVRIVAATNRDLEAEVEAGRFRLDLLYRLNVVEVMVPALRDRPEDIVDMAEHFLAFFARAACKPAPELTDEARAALIGHDWPGNVRELRNEMERAVVLGRGRVLGPESLSSRIVARMRDLVSVGADVTVERLEREHIERVIRRTATREEAARVLGIDPSTLWRKLKRYAREEGH